MASFTLAIPLVLATLASLTSGEDKYDYGYDLQSGFLFPAGGENLQITDTLNVTIDPTMAGVSQDIALWCIAPPGLKKVTQLRLNKGQLSILMQLNGASAPIHPCWLNFDQSVYNSGAFAILPAQSAASTVGLGSSHPTATPACPSSSSPSATPTGALSQAQCTNEPVAAGTITTGAVAGISVAAFVTALAVGVLATIYWQRRCRGKLSGHNHSIVGPVGGYQHFEHNSVPVTPGTTTAYAASEQGLSQHTSGVKWEVQGQYRNDSPAELPSYGNPPQSYR